MRINRTSQNLAPQVFELLISFVESNDFSWANEGEVQRIEKQKHIFVLIFLSEFHEFQFTVVPEIGSEIRCFSSNEVQRTTV